MGDPIKYHPLTGEALQPIYVSPRTGRKFWPVIGASDDPPANPDPGNDPPPDPPAEPGKKPPWGDDANFNAEKAWELIQNLRAEKAPDAGLQAELDALKATQQTQLDAIATALGLKSEDTPPDPAKLAEQISAEQGKTTEAEARATGAERKLAIVLAALDHDGNHKALLDSTSFLDSVKDIDSTDSAAIGEAVKNAVAASDHFKAAPTAPPFPGGPRKTVGKPETGPGLPRLRDAYAQSSK
jgi:hypothetical protein